MKGFREFIMRGNLIEVAVAFIMGAAFTTVTTTFTNIMASLVSKIAGGQPNFDAWQPGGLPVGAFLTALISFLLTACVIYFLIVKPINAIKARKKKDKAAEPSGPSELDVLTEIRDLMKAGS